MTDGDGAARSIARREDSPIEPARRRGSSRPPARAFAAAAAIVAALAGNGAVEAARPAVRLYTSRDGLPQAQVVSLRQDAEGFLWVGTAAGGLGRYDGHTWTVFDTSSGLPAAGVLCLDLSPDGTLFAGTTAGAARRQGQTWVHLGLRSGTRRAVVNAIAVESSRRAWLGTGTGLLLWQGDGRQTLAVECPDDLNGVGVTSIAADPRGGLWVGTVAGLARVDGGEPRRMRRVPGLPAGEVSAIHVSPDGSLLVGVTGEGLFEGAPGGFHRIGDGRTSLLRVRALLRETADPGALWVGTEDAGALRLSHGVWQPFGVAEGFPRAAVYTIFEDREGILWFGTSDGLVKRGPSAFVTFTDAEGFPEHTIAYGMAEGPAGELYFTLSDDGVVRMRPDGSVRRFTARDGLPAAGATDVAIDPRGGIWVATRGGLGRIDGERASSYRLPAGSPTALRSLLALPDGTLYLGSYREGLSVLRDGKVTRVGPPVGATVAALTVGRDGTIWCGGEGWGVVGLHAGRPPVTIGPAEQLPSGHISQIFEDSSGNLWIGSEQGAWRRDARGRISIVNRASGLPDSYVYWIREAPDGAMWFGTNHGAVRKAPGGEYQLFTSRDGLAADECNEDSALVDSKGRLFVGSEGVSVFLGSPALPPRVPCPVVVEEVKVGDRSFPTPASLRVEPGSGPLTFHLAAPTFAAEEGTRFRYRLVGDSDDWRTTEPGEVETTYGGLAPGRYRFEALAVAADGRVSPHPAVVGLTVLPRWWQSPLALASAAMVIAIGLIATIRLRERRLEAAKARLERQVLLRTDELRQANERLAALAVNDDLTGLANRRAALERLRDAMAESRRHRRPLAIALIDLDRFKEVNDALGHEMGDTVLHQVAAAMRQSLRQEDLLGRHGGDEFLAVMPACSEEGARQAGLRIQQAIAKVPLPVDQLAWAAEGLTASIGVATYDGSDDDLRQLVRWADEELYRAKAAGRNRVSVHGSR